jgi:hypothetical protein
MTEIRRPPFENTWVRRVGPDRLAIRDGLVGGPWEEIGTDDPRYAGWLAALEEWQQASAEALEARRRP